MNFSDDDEAWVGFLNGITLYISYTMQPEPEPLLLEYGISLAQDGVWIEAEIERSADQYVSKNPSYKSEVRGLAVGAIRVHRRKGVNVAVIDLTGGRDYRAWRIEFSERTCEGMGFDS